MGNEKIGFIGAGNMAQAIGLRLINEGVVQPTELIVSAPTQRNLVIWSQKGVKTSNENIDVVKRSDIIFIAVKPKFFEESIHTISQKDVITTKKVFVSIMAGKTIDFITKRIKEIATNIINFSVIRVMPNTPCMIGRGCSVLCHDRTVDISDVDKVKKMMSYTGSCEIISESIMDAVAAVSGSGPAYIYMVIESLADGAVRCGVPRDLAMRLASHTVVGAGNMVIKSGKHPGQLKDEVCSPGGTTIAAVHELEKSGVRSAFMNAVEAAYNRGVEISNAAKQ